MENIIESPGLARINGPAKEVKNTPESIAVDLSKDTDEIQRQIVAEGVKAEQNIAALREHDIRVRNHRAPLLGLCVKRGDLKESLAIGESQHNDYRQRAIDERKEIKAVLGKTPTQSIHAHLKLEIHQYAGGGQRANLKHAQFYADIIAEWLSEQEAELVELEKEIVKCAIALNLTNLLPPELASRATRL